MMAAIHFRYRRFCLFYSKQMDREMSSRRVSRWSSFVVAGLALLMVLVHAILPDGLPLTKLMGSAFNPANSSVALRGEVARVRDLSDISVKPKPHPRQHFAGLLDQATLFSPIPAALPVVSASAFASLLFEPRNAHYYSRFCPRDPPSAPVSR
jgi:hypothetical protein